MKKYTLGEKCRARLESLKDTVPQIRDVRGLGSMLAVEFMKPGTNNEPDPDFTPKVQTKAMENGLTILTCGHYYNKNSTSLPPDH